MALLLPSKLNEFPFINGAASNEYNRQLAKGPELLASSTAEFAQWQRPQELPLAP